MINSDYTLISSWINVLKIYVYIYISQFSFDTQAILETCRETVKFRVVDHVLLELLSLRA